jgi:hypothetical protein
MRWPQKGRMSNRSADGPHHIVVEKVGEGRRVANRQRMVKRLLGSLDPLFRPVNAGCIVIPLPAYGEEARWSPEQWVPRDRGNLLTTI